MNRFLLRKDQLRGSDLARVVEALEALPNERTWRVSIEQAKAERSDSQNAYLWAVPNKLLSDATGYESKEVHEFLCGTYFGWKDRKVPKTPRNPSGLESVPVRTTTTDENGNRSVLSKSAFAEYVEFVIRFAADKGVVVPPPDPDYAERREEQAA